MKFTIFDAIAKLNEIKGKSDADTHKNVKLVIDIMEKRVHKQWPSLTLCKVVHELSPDQKQILLDVLKDIDIELTTMGV